MKSSLRTACGWGRMAEPPQVQHLHPKTSRAPPGPCQPGLEEDQTLQQSSGGVERPLHSKSAKKPEVTRNEHVRQRKGQEKDGGI